MTDDELFLERAVARIRKAMFLFAGAGVLGAWLWRGPWWGAGFALGSAVSWLNFRWLKQLVYTCLLYTSPSPRD